MAELLGLEIERKRGDTAPDKVTVLDSENNNAPLDNTGFEYVLTINTAKDPEPVGPPIVGSELVQSIGTPGGADGTVLFPFTAGDANQAAGCYWYDIEQKDTGGLIKTIAKNRYTFFMDVGKTN